MMHMSDGMKAERAVLETYGAWITDHTPSAEVVRLGHTWGSRRELEGDLDRAEEAE